MSRASNSATGPSFGHERYDTIVIGAGVSGLACASRILQKARELGREHRLLVLEARDRIGGRVNSVHLGGCRLDTGANWIHGTGTKDEPNPLMGILPHKRVRELSGSVAFKSPPPPPSQYAATGNGDWEVVQADDAPSITNAIDTGDLVIPPQIGGRLMGTMWHLFDTLHETASSTPADKAQKQTMLQAIATSDVFREAFSQIPEEYHDSLRAMPQFIENMEAAPLAAQSAEGDRDMAGVGLLEFAIDDFDGAQVFVQDGYTAVVDELATELRNGGRIEIESEVEGIDWEGSPMVVKVKGGRSLQALNVVSTLPLGVLKAKCDKLFQPPLPKDKREGIDNLGFGTLDKIFMVYDRVWWAEEPFASIVRKGLVQSSEDDQKDATEPDIMMGFTHSLPGLSIHPDGHSEPGVRILSLANLHSLTGYPVLSCFVSCSNAQQIESLSDTHAQKLLHANMTSWFGREPPPAKAVHVTRWAQDPFSRGSYSHMITGVSETRHREQFQTSIMVGDDGRLGFAGEHTSRNHFATVHGALISGWREAEAIVSTWES